MYKAVFFDIDGTLVSKKDLSITPKTKEAIELLKQNNIKMGLASGSSRNSVDHHLNKLDAFKYFDATVAGKEVENGKPAPDTYLLAAEKMGVEPKDCFVFEDSPHGIKAGFAAGMKSIGIPDLIPFEPDIKKLMFAELTDLSQAIPIFEKELNLSKHE